MNVCILEWSVPEHDAVILQSLRHGRLVGELDKREARGLGLVPRHADVLDLAHLLEEVQELLGGNLGQQGHRSKPLNNLSKGLSIKRKKQEGGRNEEF